MAGLVLSAGCTCLELKVLKTPMVNFDPGFHLEGEYEVFADGERVATGTLPVPPPSSEPVVMEGGMFFNETDDGPVLIGLAALGQWRVITVTRDGETIAEGELDWVCNMIGCPDNRQESCHPEPLLMGDSP